MLEIPIAYAFTAGMLSTINPCGFVMLPAYIGYHINLESKSEKLSLRLINGIGIGLSSTLGFVFLFSSIGIFISAGGRAITHFFPYIGLAIGIGLIILGVISIITNKYIGLMSASRIQWPKRINSKHGFFIFGMAYGAASLSCTLPIFLIVVGSAITANGFVPGLIQFTSYGLGMGLVLIAITINVALFKTGINQKLHTILPYTKLMGAIALIGSGGYLVYYWTFGIGAPILFQ